MYIKSSYLKIFLFLLTVNLFLSCEQNSIIEGQIHVTEGISLEQNLHFVLNPKGTKEAIEYNIKTKKDGSFRLKIKDQGEFNIFISVLNSSLYMNENLVFSQIYQIEPNIPLQINDIYIARNFTVETMDGEEIHDNVNSIRWKPVVDADFYAVYLYHQGGKSMLLGTRETSCDFYNESPLISFDRKLSAKEMLKLAPFFRIRSPNETGEYKLRVDAIKFLPSGFESIIRSSEEYPIKLKDFVKEAPDSEANESE